MRTSRRTQRACRAGDRGRPIDARADGRVAHRAADGGVGARPFDSRIALAGFPSSQRPLVRRPCRRLRSQVICTKRRQAASASGRAGHIAAQRFESHSRGLHDRNRHMAGLAPVDVPDGSRLALVRTSNHDALIAFAKVRLLSFGRFALRASILCEFARARTLRRRPDVSLRGGRSSKSRRPSPAARTNRSGRPPPLARRQRARTLELDRVVHEIDMAPNTVDDGSTSHRVREHEPDGCTVG